MHLVKVESLVAGGVPELAAVRPLVEREWANAKRQELSKAFYDKLRAKYAIKVRMPEAGEAMMRALRRWLIALLAMRSRRCASTPVAAHELQPGFLELKESAPGRYDVLWKLPSLGGSDTRMPIAPVFPETCRQLGEARSDRAGTAWVFTARLECKVASPGRRSRSRG